MQSTYLKIYESEESEEKEQHLQCYADCKSQSTKISELILIAKEVTQS